MPKSSREITKSPMKRSPAIGTPVLVRLQDDTLRVIEDWRRKQEDMPSRPEAIRRLVELGLHNSTEPPKKKGLTGMMVKR